MRVRYFFLIIALMFTMTACTSRTAEPTDTSSSATSAPGPVVQATTWPTEMTTEFLEEVHTGRPYANTPRCGAPSREISYSA